MATIDLTQLTEVVKIYPELIGKLLLKDTILGKFVAHEGQDPGKTIIRFVSAESNLSECCADSDGENPLEEKEVTAVCIADRKYYCETDLAALLRDASVRFTAGKENAGTPGRIVTEQNLAALQKTINKLIFQGDTTLADANLNKIDGLIKQATESPDTVKLNITSGNLYTAIMQIVAAIPADAFEYGDITIMVPTNVYNAFQIGLISMNLAHYNPGTVSPREDNYRPITLPGFSNVQIVGVSGLNGTGKIIATNWNNIHWLTALKEDHMTMDWDYNKYHERYKWYVKFILGLTFGIDEYVLIADIDDTVINAPMGLPVSVVSPVDATNGGIITTPAP